MARFPFPIAVFSAFLLLTVIGCSRPPRPESPESAAPPTDAQAQVESRLAVAPKKIRTTGKADPVGCPVFTDVGRREGLDFAYDNGAVGEMLMVEATGGGAAWLDFDGDGQLDLCLVQGGDPTASPGAAGPTNRLYRRAGSGGFVSAEVAADAADGGYGQGVSAADFDNDGFDDLYVTNVGGNVLYRNLGDGTFEKVTKEAGVDDRRWSTSAAWGDLDQDGDLDLFVCNYLDYDPRNPLSCPHDDGSPGMCDPTELDALPNECFENLGDGRFRRVTKEWGLTGNPEDSKSLGVAMADLNSDGLIDIYVANDTTANFLFENQGGGRFEEVAAVRGCAMSGGGQYQASMGIALGDHDGNGFPDLYVTHFTDDSNTLYSNIGEAGFHDVTRTSGLHQPTLPRLGFGAVMADFDRNGRMDLFVTNGHIDPIHDRDDRYAMPPQLFTFRGTRWFDCSSEAGEFFKKPLVGRAVASADYDDDGDLDLAVVHQNDPLALLRNEAAAGNWLKVRLIGVRSNRSAIGALVRVTCGGREREQQLAGGTSYCASHERSLLFGLGEVDGPCQVDVRWPDGSRQFIEGLTVNQTVTIREEN